MASTNSSSDKKEFEMHPSFSSLVSKYDGFILDQFGVMHNGQNGLDGAPECVAHLASLGKKLIILSNTSSPSEMALQKLPKLGYEPSHFLGAVTSGQEASHYIQSSYGEKPNMKVLWFTWASTTQPSPRNFLNLCGSNITLVDATDADQADLIISHGSGVIQGNTIETSLGDFADTGDVTQIIQPILEKCQLKGIPMVCANPDYIMVKPDGSTGHMPGKIAQCYEQLGGKCSWFGKPHVPHFQACLRDLGLDKSRVAHVGDSLHHDVAGANGAGIDSVFVAGGVHRKQLGSELGVLPPKEALKKLFEEEGQTPTHVVPMLKL